MIMIKSYKYMCVVWARAAVCILISKIGSSQVGLRTACDSFLSQCGRYNGINRICIYKWYENALCCCASSSAFVTFHFLVQKSDSDFAKSDFHNGYHRADGRSWSVRVTLIISLILWDILVFFCCCCKPCVVVWFSNQILIFSRRFQSKVVPYTMMGDCG